MVYVYTDEGVFSFGSTQPLNNMVEGTHYFQTGKHDDDTKDSTRVRAPQFTVSASKIISNYSKNKSITFLNLQIQNHDTDNNGKPD